MVTLSRGALALLLLSATLRANAQEPATVQRARQLFMQARADYENDHFAAARTKLEESLQLVPRASTALNLAATLTRLGEPVAAKALVDDLLNGAYGAVPERLGTRVDEVLAEATSAIAHIRVRLRGSPHGELEIDGTPAGAFEGRNEIEVSVDPGEHMVSVASADGAASDTVRLAPGESFQLTLTIVSLSTPDAVTEDDVTEPSRAPRRRRRRWLWTVGTLLVAGGIATAVVFALRARPIEDDVFSTPPAALLSF